MKALAACAYAIFSQGGHFESHAYFPQLLSLINEMTPEKLRIQLPPPSDRCYYEYVRTNIFTMCAFVLRKGACIPLHDHPGMTVLSKIVHGSLHVKTFALKEKTSFHTIGTISHATKGSDTIIHAPENLSIHPNGQDNIHSFEALSDYVVLLDIIAPPYSEMEGRPCTYFEELRQEGHDFILKTVDEHFECTDLTYTLLNK